MKKFTIAAVAAVTLAIAAPAMARVTSPISTIVERGEGLQQCLLDLGLVEAQEGLVQGPARERVKDIGKEFGFVLLWSTNGTLIEIYPWVVNSRVRDPEVINCFWTWGFQRR